MANEKKTPPEIQDLLARKQAETAFIARAWKDEAFKKALLANPKATIEEAVGATLPKSAKVTIHEEGPDEYHYVLPAAPKASGELSDAELESVAGGKKKHKSHDKCHKDKKRWDNDVAATTGATVIWDSSIF